jgi:hypothetical protein
MLRAGLIGIPSTGKTTLFHLLTRAPDKHSSNKFDRRNATVAVASIPDLRLDKLDSLFQPKRKVPATVFVADIIGSEGPRQLVDVAPYREADALLHVVRAFRNEDIPHSSSHVDAARDAQSMEEELILADLDVAERRIERIQRDIKKEATSKLKLERQTLEKCRMALEAGNTTWFSVSLCQTVTFGYQPGRNRYPQCQRCHWKNSESEQNIVQSRD